VVACNTATAAAVHLLREAYPDMPIVGVEPGVKPAVAQSRNRRVGVLATPSTLSSDKFRRLIKAHGHDATIVTQACPGLAHEIERGMLDTPALRALVHAFALPLKQAEVDTVVMGCTHYPFVAPLFQRELGPGVRIIDTAMPVADHTARLCAAWRAFSQSKNTPTKGSSGDIQLFTSGDPAHLSEVYLRWFGLPCPVSVLG
jgi:glutamate racemase